MSALSTAGYFIIKMLYLSLVYLILNLIKNKKMRYFDGLQTQCKDEFLKLSIAYAKGEIIEFNLPPSTDVKALALDYCHQYGCIMGDLEPYNPVTIPAWVGTRPIKVPR